MFLWGAAATITQYLRASLIDETHLAIAPVLLGSGERLFGDLRPAQANYRCFEHASRQPLPRPHRADWSSRPTPLRSGARDEYNGSGGDRT
jgi:dihydrofolate reductase